MLKKTALILFSIFSLLPTKVSAHEAYVLTSEQFQTGLKQPFINPFESLTSPSNLILAVTVASVVTVLLFVYLFIMKSRLGQTINQQLQKVTLVGSLIIRFALAAALFFSASSNSFLGPEVSLSFFPYPELLRIFLYMISVMICFGFLTELAALIALSIFLLALTIKGTYMVTYFNYLGEFLVLGLFGMRFLSIDQRLFGSLKRFKSFRDYETVIIRIYYGLALCYAAFYVKFLHPALTIEVFNEYHLAQFTYLFPSDPLLTTLGAAIVEFTIGLFIIVGFGVRLVTLVSLFYITLSLLYFQEAVWPHLMLYGISISLFFSNGGKLSLENYFIKHLKR